MWPNSTAVLQRKRVLANGGLLEVHRGACQQAVVNFMFAAIPVVRGEDENRTVFSIADLADAGPISSVFNHRI